MECLSGEDYRIEAIQDEVNLGLIDHAHVQPSWEYHYHGASESLIETLEWENMVHLGYASDWFPLYYSKKWTYSPSFSLSTTSRTGTSCTYRGKDFPIDGTTPDGTFVSDRIYDRSGDLDECNGIIYNEEYSYFITDDFPYGPRCLNGAYTESRPSWGGAWRWARPQHLRP